MATETEQPPMTVADLVAFTKRQLESDAEQQAHIKAAGVVGGHLQSQTGSTLDLSRLEIPALPVEVVALIKDRVERYVWDNGGWDVEIREWLTKGIGLHFRIIQNYDYRPKLHNVTD